MKQAKAAIKTQLFPTDRLVAYSDALFGFAATLLVLGLRIPSTQELNEESLFRFLLDQWPAYLSFVLSFIIITAVWSNHHTMFQYIKTGDHVLVLINSLLMLDIVAIPFGAGLLGQHLMGPGENARTAALVYGGIISIGGIPFNLVWWYGTRDGDRLRPGTRRETVEEISRHFRRGPFLYTAATLLALWNVWISVAGFVGLILLYLLPAAWAARAKAGKQ